MTKFFIDYALTARACSMVFCCSFLMASGQSLYGFQHASGHSGGHSGGNSGGHSGGGGAGTGASGHNGSHHAHSGGMQHSGGMHHSNSYGGVRGFGVTSFGYSGFGVPSYGFSQFGVPSYGFNNFGYNNIGIGIGPSTYPYNTSRYYPTPSVPYYSPSTPSYIPNSGRSYPQRRGSATLYIPPNTKLDTSSPSTPQKYTGPMSADGQPTGELKPGMVLPDGSIVVSVGSSNKK